MCFLCERTKLPDLITICAFTPIEDKEDIIKDQFCHSLEQVYGSIPANDI
jgi:hypothetical protein